MAKGEYFVCCQRRICFNDNGQWGLTPSDTVLSNDPCFANARMALKDAFNFRGVNIFTARDDHVLDTVLNGEESLVIHDPDIAGSQPSIHQRVRGGIRAIPVLAHNVFTTNQHLTRFTYWKFIAVAVSDFHLSEEERLATGLRLANRIDGVHQARWTTGLGESVHLCHIDAHLLELLR